METLFILGAGFSKWVEPQMPLLNDLIKIIPGRLIDDIKRQKLEYFLGDNKLEELITYLSTPYPWKQPDEKLIQFSLAESLTDFIADHFRSIEIVKDYKLDDSDIIALAKYWARGHHKILTFNYDTIVERMIDKAVGNRQWHEYWDIPITNVIQRTNIDTAGYIAGQYDPTKRYITLTKLHGSWNWYRSRYNPQPNEQIYYEPNAPFNDDVVTNLQGLKAFIIPPAVDKSNYLQHDLLSIIWNRARKNLLKADRIFIIGYSIPQSDNYISLLFGSSLNSKKQVFVVNRNNSEEFKNRIEKHFECYGIKPDFQFTGGEDAINRLIATLKE